MNMVKVKRTAGSTKRKPLMARRLPRELGPPALGAGEGFVMGAGAVMLVMVEIPAS